MGPVRFVVVLVVAGLSAALSRTPARAETFETKARFAILMEAADQEAPLSRSKKTKP